MPTRLEYLRSLIEKRLYASGLLPAGRLCLPDFLGIGAQKAGTTWLYENLRRHPELYLPETKELHYFDWHYHQPLRAYARQFEPGRGRIKGEITPGYGILPRERIAFVRRLMPELRLILLLRDPVERAWSQALMNLVKLPGRRYEDVHEREFLDHFVSARSVERGDYLATIDNWLAYYAPERMFVGFYDDIAARPRELLVEILAHLGASIELDLSGFPLEEVVFPGARVPLPDKFRKVLAGMYRDDLVRLRERFGKRAALWPPEGGDR